MSIDDAKKLDQEVEDVLKGIDTTDVAADPVSPQPSKAQMDLKVAAIVPIHQAVGLQPKRGPGRPKKILSQPTVDDLAYHAEMARRQVEFVESDTIVQGAQARKDSADMLNILRERLARVHATLDFRRIEDEKRGGREAPQILSRQMAVLRELAQIELKIEERGVQTVDLRSEKMQKVFALFVKKIQDTAEATLPKPQFDLFFNRLETALDGWEDEADSLIR